MLLCTDGLSNSYAQQQGFLQFAEETHKQLLERGADRVRSHLGSWLAQAAAHSGDDSTLTAAFTAD